MDSPYAYYPAMHSPFARPPYKKYDTVADLSELNGRAASRMDEASSPKTSPGLSAQEFRSTGVDKSNPYSSTDVGLRDKHLVTGYTLKKENPAKISKRDFSQFSQSRPNELGSRSSRSHPLASRLLDYCRLGS